MYFLAKIRAKKKNSLDYLTKQKIGDVSCIEFTSILAIWKYFGVFNWQIIFNVFFYFSKL